MASRSSSAGRGAQHARVLGLAFAPLVLLSAACGGAIAPDDGSNTGTKPQSGQGKAGDDPSTKPGSGSSPGSPGSSPSSEPSGTGRPCTEIGCSDGVDITLVARRWKLGAYRFYLDTGNQQVDCTGKLPLAPCSSGPSLQCLDNVTGKPVTNVTIGESGCALGPEAQGFSGIHIADTPATVVLEITRDGALVGADKFAVRYQTVQPNGPECGPVCRQANRSVRIDDR